MGLKGAVTPPAYGGICVWRALSNTEIGWEEKRSVRLDCLLSLILEMCTLLIKTLPAWRVRGLWMPLCHSAIGVVWLLMVSAPCSILYPVPQLYLGPLITATRNVCLELAGGQLKDGGVALAAREPLPLNRTTLPPHHLLQPCSPARRTAVVNCPRPGFRYLFDSFDELVTSCLAFVKVAFGLELDPVF